MSMKELFEPIETDVGIISGRDAIFLNEIKFDYSKQSVGFYGKLNSHLCSKSVDKNEWIKYSLTFVGILSFQMVELDFADFRGKSSFDLVLNSKLLKNFEKYDSANKVKSEHKHYFLQTYDDIFEIICLSFELKLLESREMN